MIKIPNIKPTIKIYGAINHNAKIIIPKQEAKNSAKSPIIINPNLIMNPINLEAILDVSVSRYLVNSNLPS